MIFDKICIKGICGKGYHGFYDNERAIGQNFHVDVVMEVDTSFNSLTDNLEKTVNYEKVGKAVVEIIEGESVKLIETLSERIAYVVLEFEHVFQVSVTVHKPEAPLDYSFKDIEVTITRNRANIKIERKEGVFFVKGTNIRDEDWSISQYEKAQLESNVLETDLCPIGEKYTLEHDKSNIEVPVDTKVNSDDFIKRLTGVEDIKEPEGKTELIQLDEKAEDFAPIFHPEKADVILALGANLGYPAQIFQDVISDLDKALGFEVVDVSPLLKNKAHTLNGEIQPDYYNCILRGKTFLSEKTLLCLTEEVEEYFGRSRGKKWASRLIDIDIISYNNAKYSDEKLTIPHPMAKERIFVLLPWVLMEPNAKLGEEKVQDLLDNLDGEGIVFVWNEWLGKTQEELDNILLASMQENNIEEKEIVSENTNSAEIPTLTHFNEDLEFETTPEGGLRILDEGIDIFSGQEVVGNSIVIEPSFFETPKLSTKFEEESLVEEAEFHQPTNNGVDFIIKSVDEIENVKKPEVEENLENEEKIIEYIETKSEEEQEYDYLETIDQNYSVEDSGECCFTKDNFNKDSYDKYGDEEHIQNENEAYLNNDDQIEKDNNQSNESKQFQENKEVLEALHTMEHNKVMNQLRTLFSSGVEDEITTVDTSNKLDPIVINLDKIKVNDNQIESSIKDKNSTEKENAEIENKQPLESIDEQIIPEDDAQYLRVASNLASTPIENSIVSSPLVTMENLPNIEVEEENIEPAPKVSEEQKGADNKEIPTTEIIDDKTIPATEKEVKVVRDRLSAEFNGLANLIKDRERKKLLRKEETQNKVERDIVNEQTQIHKMDFEEKPNIYDILRNKTVDKVSKDDKQDSIYSFKPKWQAIN